MRAMKIIVLLVFALGTFIGLALTSLSQAAQPQTSSAAAGKQVGTIKSVTGNVIVLVPDTGAEITLSVQDSTRIVRIAPGEKDLKNATPITLRDLQPGDRILVHGTTGPSGQWAASSVLAMKRNDLEQKQQREREDWQSRGVAGLVTAVDSSAGTVALTVGSFAAKKQVVVHTTKETVVKRYSPGSVRFDDAKLGTLAQIKPGDQLRARGARNADGSEFAAEEIVSGSFRNIAGIVGSVDASSGTVTVLDSATKKAILVKVTGDSQLRNLPAEMAKRMAMRMMGGGPGVPGGPGGPPSGPSAGPGAPGGPPNGMQPTGGFRREPGVAGEIPGGGPQRRGDIQQMFNRLPALSLADMQKGDTVMLVASEGSDSSAVTAIKLLDGVEPLLAAAPKTGGETMTLSPWSLGGGGGGGGEEATP